MSFEAVRGHAASEDVVDSEGLGLSMDERRRMLEANAAAAQYFRRELLRATDGWPLEYLKAHGAESVLEPDSPWKVGYAPRTWSNLVDHLQERGFSYGTLARAGLMWWNEHGEAVDLHRDKLMLVARDRRLSGVGFVGIGPDGYARSVSPMTAIHRPTNVLVGIDEQRELLSHGAVPVLVNSPMDAIVVSNAGLLAGGLWASIPMCGAGMSTIQAKTLRDLSTSDTAVVVLSGSHAERKQGVRSLTDLDYFFDKLRVASVRSGASLPSMFREESGAERVNKLLRNSRSLMSYRASGRRIVGLPNADLDPPAPAPGY